MGKYIDAKLLRKEIETLKDEYTDIAIDSQRGWVNANFVIDDLERLQSQIDSLQQEQPEVDLDAEISTWIPAHIKGNADKEMNIAKKWGEAVARHFYELGLKAK